MGEWRWDSLGFWERRGLREHCPYWSLQSLLLGSVPSMEFCQDSQVEARLGNLRPKYVCVSFIWAPSIGDFCRCFVQWLRISYAVSRCCFWLFRIGFDLGLQLCGIWTSWFSNEIDLVDLSYLNSIQIKIHCGVHFQFQISNSIQSNAALVFV